MENEYHGRFKGADWYGINPAIIVGGAGGLGSWLTLLLTRMGLTKVGVYDHDMIEGHNLSGQLFKESQINSRKVDALNIVCKEFTGNEIYRIPEKYDVNSMRADFMFACFDNMAARKIMFAKWKLKDTRELLVDIRLDFEQIDIYFVTKENEDKFQEYYLYDDDEAEEPQCSMKQTSHIAALASSMAVAGFTNYLSPDEGRDVLFHQVYVVPLNYYSYDK